MFVFRFHQLGPCNPRYRIDLVILVNITVRCSGEGRRPSEWCAFPGSSSDRRFRYTPHTRRLERWPTLLPPSSLRIYPIQARRLRQRRSFPSGLSGDSINFAAFMAALERAAASSLSNERIEDSFLPMILPISLTLCPVRKQRLRSGHSIGTNLILRHGIILP